MGGQRGALPKNGRWRFWKKEKFSHVTLVTLVAMTTSPVPLNSTLPHDPPDNDKNVLELRAETFRREGVMATGFLPHYGNDVVANVTLPHQLLPVVRGEGEQRGNVE